MFEDNHGHMTPDSLEKNFSNIPIVKENHPLGDSQPFAVSFVKEDD